MPQVVLDLGCGVGRLTRSLAKAARLVVGLDYSAAMIERAHKDASGLNTLFVQGSATEMPFASQSFDGIVVSGVLQHIPAGAPIDSACAEIARVVRPHGTILMLEGSTDPVRMHESASNPQHYDLRFYRDRWAGRVALVRSERVVLIEDEYTFSTWVREK
jgi:ubiquinone/menaquinone biosynthesis C-methylase UbiE